MKKHTKGSRVPKREKKRAVGHLNTLQRHLVEPPQDDFYWVNRSIDDPKKDWEQSSGTWLDGYTESKSHSHRSLIINSLQTFGTIESILEIGCNCAPNLSLIREKINIPDDNLFGIDVNSDVIKKAKELLPACNFTLGSAEHLSFPDKSFDIVLCDAILIYVNQEKIEKVINEIDRVARRGIILVEWFDKSMKGVIKDFHWARNYTKLLEQKGFKVEEIKITKENWDNKKWIKHGRLFVARHQSAILEKN